MNKLILIFGWLILISCNLIKSDPNKTAQTNANTDTTLTSIDLGHGFKITFGQAEDYTDFKTKLYKDDALLFNDSITEFEVKDKYPSLRKIRNGYEMLLFVNDRPDIDKLLLLKIYNNTVASQAMIPYFEMVPKDVDADGKPELAGIMSYYQMGGENGHKMPYVPILVYEYTDWGITLDTVETKNVNRRVYGKFYGFEYSEKYEFKGNERFGKELNKFK
jgi:hypothetical protein